MFDLFNLVSSRCFVTLFFIYFLKYVSAKTYPWDEKFQVKSSVCTTGDCYEFSNFIIDHVNTLVNPCDDFYEYACSKWEKKYGPLLYYPEWSVDSEMGERAFYQIRNILEEKDSSKDNDELRDAKKFYRECMELPSLSVYDGVIIASYVRGAGYFPMFENPKESRKKSWVDVHNYYLGLSGESSFVDISIRNDRSTKYKPMLHLVEGFSPFGSFSSYEPLDIPQLRNYEKFLVSLLKRVMVHPANWKTYSLIQKDLMDVLAFRRELLTIKSHNYMTDKYHKIMTVKKLDEWYHSLAAQYRSTAQISWINVFWYLYRNKQLLDKIKHKEVDVENRTFLRLLARLLDKTPENVIVNHIHIYFIERHLQLDSRLRNMMLEVIVKNGKLIGKMRYLGIRWHLCLASNQLKEALGRRYVSKYFPPSIRNDVADMIDDLKNMIKLEISDSPWLDNYTSKRAIQLISDMRSTIGYPDYFDDRYVKIEFAGSTVIDPGSVDTFYSPESNRLSVSAAYLSPPLYSSALPETVSYGGIGMNIAHEMYHAFGLENMQRVDPEYCWPPSIVERHRQKSQCFVNQFKNVPVIELNDIHPIPRINGNTTLDENLADTMGLKLAYRTLKKKMWETKKCKHLPNLPGINCHKLFFLSFATSFCSVLTKDRMLEYIDIGVHATPRIRVNGAVANMPEFSKVFQCSKSAPLNRQPKCDLWQ